MAEIICPKCGTVISLEPTELDSVVRQVRDEEFQKEIEARTKAFEQVKEQAVAAARAKERAEAEKREASLKDQNSKELASLNVALEKSKAESSTLVLQVKAQAAEEASKKDTEIQMLKAQLKNMEEMAQTQQELEVSKAVAQVEKERDALASSLDLQKMEAERNVAAVKEQANEQLKAKDDVIAYQREEIERIKDMRSRLSTKMIGESLEQHCQTEFDRIRATAFPHAYFEKDNDASDGSKGDFIFRECDDTGNEIVSIMFEMKNESDSDSTKFKNETFFAKLDKDRTKKKCEYAVLVSLLEPESELYNEGIVDVSHRYPKMYVIRPQFFIPLISLLRNAALGALKYKQELALVRQQEMDITTFEQDLETFKNGFFKNFGDASLRFGDAIKAIDKAIDDLQKAKDKLLVSEKHLNAANNKLEGLTVKKLTRKNPTMKAKFDALHEEEN